MSRKLGYFGLLTLLVVGLALCSASAKASTLTFGVSPITVTNEWQLGESDSGTLGGTAAATAVDDLGGWNLTGVNTGSTLATYVAGASGAFGPSTLAVNFNNTGGTGGVSGTAQEYYCSYNSTSGTYISSTSNANWGCDFWFNCSSNATNNPTPVLGTTKPEVMLTLGCKGGWETAVTPAFAIGLGGNSQTSFYVTNYAGGGYSPSNDFVPTAGNWYHFVYADENGTGYVWVTDASGNTDVSASLGTSLAPNLSSLPDNIDVGCRANAIPSNAFQGALDEVRIFTFAAGTFNVADTAITSVPEPGTLALLTAGLVGLLAYAWRKRK
jgi:hypothetical protein